MKNREITLKEELERIIGECDVCSLAMVDQEGKPYVIPMNFGYAGDVIYLHSSQTGKKIDVLKNNNNVSVAFSTDHELRWQSEKVACSYSMKYRSVLAYGKVEFVEDKEDKVNALNIIMKNYTDREFKYNDPSILEVMVFKVRIENMTGRAYGY
jgi:nitroimidazol reductase NimA-like FMN-containing flavoprotein (pyridoxamine 5'-phosphate oxidase superfamily)